MPRSTGKRPLPADKDDRLGNLPVNGAYDIIVKCCADHGTVIVVGETGSGKSTQIPQFLMELRTFGGRVAVTQPRRVAAMSLAQRVAWERNIGLGSIVGYTVRFDNRTSKATRLRYMTDGMLLREAMIDPLLLCYSVVILDEAHERSLDTDILLGIVKRAQLHRRMGKMPLRVVVMSATLDAVAFLDYFLPKPAPNGSSMVQEFDKPAAVYIEGRQHWVDILYADTAQNDYLDAAIVTVLQIHLDEAAPGDILCFLTGQEEIEACSEMLEEKSRNLPADALKLIVCPIFAALPMSEQLKVFSEVPPGSRKVILATNIAETSITIAGVRYVIDPGMVKSKSYSAATGVDMLKVGPVSQEQAWQRAGRAGREAPGKCYRLFCEFDFLKLAKRTIPEIKRVELTQVVLQLLTLGVEDVMNFDFVSPPPKAVVQQAMFTLLALGAIEIPSKHDLAVQKNAPLDNSGKRTEKRVPVLTELGRRMAALPLDPMHSKLLLDSVEMGCTKEALTITAMLSVDSPFYSPRTLLTKANKAHARYASFDADHIALLNIHTAFVEAGRDKQWCTSNFIKCSTLLKAERVREQLVEMIKSVCPDLKQDQEFPSCSPEVVPVLRCLVKAFSLRVAQKLPRDNQPGVRYKTLMDSVEARIHPSSCLSQRDPMPDWIVFSELVMTSKKYLKCVAAVDQKWLSELAPALFAMQQNKRHFGKRTNADNAKNEDLVSKRKLLMCD